VATAGRTNGPKPTGAPGCAAAPPLAAATVAAPVVVGGVRLPTCMPYSGMTPGSPGSADGLVDPGYKAYPSSRTKSVQATPGDGSDINIMTFTLGANASALEQNPGWQEVNRQVGAN
jgi:putative aldouronate transport system substrate-binding protein